MIFLFFLLELSKVASYGKFSHFPGTYPVSQKIDYSELNLLLFCLIETNVEDLFEYFPPLQDQARSPPTMLNNFPLLF